MLPQNTDLAAGVISDRDLPFSESSDASSVSEEESSSPDDFSDYSWTCCGRRNGAQGCMPERRHLLASEVAPEKTAKYDDRRQISWDLRKRVGRNRYSTSESEG